MWIGIWRTLIASGQSANYLTKPQWEKAARGTGGYKYPWGYDAPNNNLLNYNQNVGDTTAVDSYPSGASPYGALDMAGNVGQWVADWYTAYHRKHGE